MIVATVPRYEAPTASHAIAVEFENIYGKLKTEDEKFDMDYLPNPIRANMPYLPEEHMKLMHLIADGTADAIIMIGRPASLKVFKAFSPKKLILFCTPLLQISMEDYEGLDILAAAGGEIYCFNKETKNWLEQNTEQPVTKIKLDIPFYSKWDGSRGEHDGLYILNTNMASLGRQVSMGMQGVTIVTTPANLEAVKGIVPLDEKRGLTKVIDNTGVTPDCFVLDKSNTIPQILEFFSKGLYPVIGAQYEDIVLRELAALLDADDGYMGEPIVRVHQITEKIPGEALLDLERLNALIEKYRAMDIPTFSDVIKKLGGV